jgi:hypothetical protein
MNITLDVASFYATHILRGDDAAPPGAATKVVQEGGGDKQAVVYVRREPSTTVIHVPGGSLEQSYADEVAAYASIGRMPKHPSFPHFVAFHLEEVMSHHSGEVLGVAADDPAVEAHLQRVYGVSGLVHLDGDGNHVPPTPAALTHEESRAAMWQHYAPPAEVPVPVRVVPDVVADAPPTDPPADASVPEAADDATPVQEG